CLRCACVACLAPGPKSVLDHAVAIRNGLEDGMPADAATAAADVLDDDLVERDVPRVALELEGLNHVVDVQAVEHAMERPLGLIVPVDVAILAARSGVELVDHHLVLAWAEPLDDQVWLEECTVHERRRRIELPLGVDEGGARRGVDLGLHDRFLPLCFLRFFDFGALVLVVLSGVVAAASGRWSFASSSASWSVRSSP